ncbi:MAG: hypothetical protein CMP47_12505 [Rickettsiales bacterium]|nr:hypothetical protein [Rickettsiales bacterium]
MIVCVCNAVNERAIAKCVEEHSCSSVRDLQQYMKICDQCCVCNPEIKRIINTHGSLHSIPKREELRSSSLSPCNHQTK